ncbi:MAG: hypothetical protein J5699_01425 [Bacteroidales bacterium]|nr:hypothetical protein [Bacteroidales bacterium]
MKRIIILISFLAILLSGAEAFAQRIQDGSYRTVGYIKSDGTVQDGSYRTIGHTDGVPSRWAAWFFFFR